MRRMLSRTLKRTDKSGGWGEAAVYGRRLLIITQISMDTLYYGEEEAEPSHQADV